MKVNIPRLTTVEAASQQWSIGDTYFNTTTGLQLTYNGSGWDDTASTMLVSGTNIKTINGSSVLGSGDLSVGGGSSITGTSIFNFGLETDFVINTIANASITNSNVKSFSILPQETTETSIDDFSLNAVGFTLDTIIDNTSFSIRASANNNASGNYTIKYLIQI